MKKILSYFFILFSIPAYAWELGHLGQFSFQPFAEQLYIMHGPLAEPNKENQGFMNNPAFIESQNGLILVDPGSSYQTGKNVLSEIKKITPKPILAVFNTHIHGDHWFANQAIKEAFPQVKIYGHPNMIRQANGNKALTWLESMHRMTEGLSRDTTITPPHIAVKHQDKITIDNQDFIIYHFQSSHTDTDIIIENTQGSIIFLGDNAFNGRFGQFDESANISGNIDALQFAKSRQAKFYVPGHGQSGSFAKAAQKFLDYLIQLKSSVTSGYESDLEDYEIKNKIQINFLDYQNWIGFDVNFGKHINKMYLEIESE